MEEHKRYAMDRPNARNLGGRSQIVTQHYNHHKALSKAKGWIKIKPKRKHVDDGKKKKFNELTFEGVETFRRVYYKRTDLKNKLPYTFHMARKVGDKKKSPGELYEIEQHRVNLFHSKKRIDKIYKRKKPKKKKKKKKKESESEEEAVSEQEDSEKEEEVNFAQPADNGPCRFAQDIPQVESDTLDDYDELREGLRSCIKAHDIDSDGDFLKLMNLTIGKNS